MWRLHVWVSFKVIESYISAETQESEDSLRVGIKEIKREKEVS